MYILVQFIEDDVYYVCQKKLLKKIKGKTFAKWLDGKWYLAKQMVSMKKKCDLENLAFNIKNRLPKIVLRRETCLSTSFDLIKATTENSKREPETYVHSDDLSEDDMFNSSDDSIYIPESESESDQSSSEEINCEDELNRTCNICCEKVTNLKIHLQIVHCLDKSDKKLLKIISDETVNEDEEEVISFTNPAFDFLGHAFNIHENIYRQVPVVRDVVEVGNMLTGALGLNQDEVQSDFVSNELENTSNQEDQSLEDVTLSISQVENVFHDLSTVIEENDGASVESNINIPESNINIPESNINTPVKKKQRNRLFATNFSSVQRRTWMTPERHAARNLFQWYINNKKVPSIKTTQRLARENDDLQRRTVSQIQTWIIAEIQRNSKTGSRRIQTWRTPEKSACRLHFAPYYKTKTYPPQSELQEAISVVPELRNVSPNRLKSHLQHDFKYLTLKQTLESEYYRN